jgi:hypothetical protein
MLIIIGCLLIIFFNLFFFYCYKKVMKYNRFIDEMFENEYKKNNIK